MDILQIIILLSIFPGAIIWLILYKILSDKKEEKIRKLEEEKKAREKKEKNEKALNDYLEYKKKINIETIDTIEFSIFDQDELIYVYFTCDLPFVKEEEGLLVSVVCITNKRIIFFHHKGIESIDFSDITKVKVNHRSIDIKFKSKYDDFGYYAPPEHLVKNETIFREFGVPVETHIETEE